MPMLEAFVPIPSSVMASALPVRLPNPCACLARPPGDRPAPLPWWHPHSIIRTLRGREEQEMAPWNCLLVIDDDHDILFTLRDALEMEGYSVATARTGREALKKLEQGLRPHLILLDLMMPDISGWTFRNLQMQDPELAAIPVVVVSGQGLSTSDVAELGVEGYLPKPLDLDDLLNTVARFVPTPEPPGVASW